MSKLVDLNDALRESIGAGSVVHLTTNSRAATRAIQREFRNEELGLTLIMCRVGGGHAADLVASGLVRKVVAGSYGAMSRHHVGGFPQIGRTYSEGLVVFQHWSLLTLTQRLRAAALGLGFAQTNSLVGSTMAAENAGDFELLASPFGNRLVEGIMSPLAPDVSIVHVQAADEEGNAILIPPQEDGAWGAFASRGGAIVTAEHIVSRDFIRRHSHLTQLPARYVRSVCHVPYGAHPGRFGSPVLAELNSYSADEEFDKEYFAVSRDPTALEQWMEQWVYGPSTHDDFLALLGKQRLQALTTLSKAPSVSAKTPPPVPSEIIVEASPDEVLMTLALREIQTLVSTMHYDILLVGVGLSEVPATAAHYLLAKEGVDVPLAMGHGFFNFEPTPGHSEPDADATIMSTDASTIYGLILGGARRSGLAILGAAQIDRHGNLNSTIVGGKLLTGSGGANDAASVCDTIVVTRLNRRKCVPDVEYVTCPGNNVRALVTDRGVFRKNETTTRLELSAIVGQGKPFDEAVAEIAEECGWEMEVGANVQLVDPPTLDELTVIRWLMPERYQSGS